MKNHPILAASTKAAMLASALMLAACATQNSGGSASPAVAAPALPQSSAECLAAKIKPGEPFPASAIPDEVLRKRQNGWVAMRYDLVAGRAQNVVVAASNPAGLYDPYALQHAMKFRDPGGATVRGCVMTIDVKF